MTGRMQGKVAFITGAARGQGRSHAVRLAEEGADVIAVDLCADIDTVSPYFSLSTEDDLAETAREVEKTGSRVVARKADVRDVEQLRSVFDEGVAQLGQVDTVVANAGIVSFSRSWEISAEQWQDVLDVNLTGVFHTAKVAIPGMIEADAGGSILFTSSIGGYKGVQTAAHYASAKHGVVGLMRTLAQELAPHNIRVNTVHPTSVDTTMIQNPGTYGQFTPEGADLTQDNAVPGFMSLNAMPVPWVDPIDVSNAILFLASDEARYVTGATFPVDAGASVK